MKSVPPSVHFAESWATNFVPVGLRIFWRSDCEVLCLSAYWPSSLGDPDLLSTNDGCCLIKSSLEQRLSTGDGIGFGVLEVWVCINSDPVDRVNDGFVGAVGPGSPGIDVSNGRSSERSSLQGSSELCDVSGESLWLCTISTAGGHSNWADSVQILTSNRDTNDQVCEIRTPLCDCRLEGRDFGSEEAVTTRRPETEEEGCLLGDGGRDGLDGLVG